MTPPNHIHYDTKEQLQHVLNSWGVKEAAPPKKGKQLLIVFPPPAHFNQVTITVHNVKSTYGKTLYKMEFKAIH